ncbi:hypothetical protein NQ315_011465 [Exocentrus adspersus]|uniref:phosphoserine transaminase n=1 Tax=Exocentrus adspersus TaxID=1586481 RepID=A0AAV8VVB7_9CUCU|nr:hypothetical protein NQ315_011465 [Exocentrus adspersus]
MGSSQSALNFGAGPAKLPREVLNDVQYEFISYQNAGMSIIEMSHRSKEYITINKNAQDAIRKLLNVPSNYEVLFMQGGGCGAFAAVALNLINRTGTADYAVTGTWSGKAAKEATKYGKVNLLFPKADKPGSIPDQKTWNFDPNASYVYYCDNETVDGVEFPYVPNTNGVPIVCDMSSSIMTKTLDISKFGVIFGGAQKNIGPAGVVVVIIRKDLFGASHDCVVYVMEKVLQWIIKQGGVKAMQKQAEEKSGLLYKTISNSNSYYSCPIDENVRSRINIPFRVGGKSGNEKLEEKFLEEAEKLSMFQLKGHRSVGGIRASLYNAVSLDDVKSLVKFMEEFQKEHPH